MTSGESRSEFLGGSSIGIIALNVRRFAEGYLARAVAFVFRAIDGLEFFALTFGVVFDGDFKGIEAGHNAVGALVQVFAQREFQRQYSMTLSALLTPIMAAKFRIDSGV